MNVAKTVATLSIGFALLRGHRSGEGAHWTYGGHGGPKPSGERCPELRPASLRTSRRSTFAALSPLTFLPPKPDYSHRRQGHR
jgi:hypothetical protein